MVKETDILKKFGNHVKELRIKKGISSQIDLALKAGLDRTYIGGIERGECWSQKYRKTCKSSLR